MSESKRLGVLLSGRGSNFVAIADAIANGRLQDVEIAVVISNMADAPGLQAARARRLNAVAIEARGRKRVEHDAEIVESRHRMGIQSNGAAKRFLGRSQIALMHCL